MPGGVARSRPEVTTVSRTRRRNPLRNRITTAAAAKEVREFLAFPADAALPVAPADSPAPAQNAREVFEEEVRLQAYLKWEAAGGPPGGGTAFWLEAERELQGP
jgi:hypothetical protein